MPRKSPGYVPDPPVRAAWLDRSCFEDEDDDGVRADGFAAPRDGGFAGAGVRPDCLGFPFDCWGRGCWGREGCVGEAAPARVSRRRAERARERSERLEKDMPPRYYVLRFQHGQANVGDC